MARQPDDVMREVVARSRRIASTPPGVLHNPPGTGVHLSPVREDDAVTAVHRDWAEVHAPPRGRAAAGYQGGVRARVRARVTATADAALEQQQVDRFLIGDLIRALDAVAKRVDEIGERVQLLERIVDEMVVVMGQDITAVRATLAGMLDDGCPPFQNLPDG